jgi:uncharacterized protein YjbI with pentapeptide repeats
VVILFRGLADCDLSGATLQRASFEGVGLYDANFKGADLTDCEFYLVLGMGAEFDGAILRNTVIVWRFRVVAGQAHGANGAAPNRFDALEWVWLVCNEPACVIVLLLQ